MSLSRLMSKRERKRDKPNKLRLFSGDLYSNEDKPRKSSDDSTSVSPPVFLLSSSWNCHALLAAAWGINPRLPPHLPSQQVTKIAAELAKSGIKVEDATIQRVLRGRYANGDVDRALELLLMIEDSNDGIVVSRVAVDGVKILGAENNGGVTCYLDTLLFAMFARLDAFEAMLYNVFDEEDEKRRKLAALIRLYVNLLRTGKLVTTDIMSQIQQSIAACGWKEAASLRQQDPSEVFTFITDTLQLPLLTVKVDIAHGGKEVVEDDHKFISERLLNVALPDETVDPRDPIPLEVCLEEYFNGRVDVKRQLERRATIDSVYSFDSGKGKAIHIETADLGSSVDTPLAAPVSPQPLGLIAKLRKPPLVRTVKVENEIELGSGKLKKSTTMRKEVMLPAWCFFSILPFYTDASLVPVPATFAEHFSAQRPVLGLCLKRYSWTPSDGAKRDPRRVDIPLQIALPTFVADDEMGEDDGPLYGNFKLVLQSAVCHRGNSVQSGHYIALIRGAEDKWLRFDDLAIAGRVSEVEHEKAFEEESPYMLFYQVQPIDEDSSVTTPSVASTIEHGIPEKRLSMISGGSTGSTTRSSAELEIHESSTFSEPPVYEQHDTRENCASPPPPYIVENVSPTSPTSTPTLASVSLLAPESTGGGGLRPTSRPKTRPGSKEGPVSRSQSVRRSKSVSTDKRSSWAALMTRGKSQDKERGHKSAEWARLEPDEEARGQEVHIDDAATATTTVTTPAAMVERFKERREKGKGKDKGKGKAKEAMRINRKSSKDKDLRECIIQ